MATGTFDKAQHDFDVQVLQRVLKGCSTLCFEIGENLEMGTRSIDNIPFGRGVRAMGSYTFRKRCKGYG